MSRILSLLRLFGFDPVQTLNSIRGLVPFLRDYHNYKNQTVGTTNKFPNLRFYPCLGDRYLEAGAASGGYFHQDIIVANRIYRDNPKRHIDIGSRIDGFVAHVAVFRMIEVMDVRELSTSAHNIKFMQRDLMAPLDDQFIGCCDSLSCLHALEHFGLGRYGDPVTVDGYKVAFANMVSMLDEGGRLYLSVPIGFQRLEFNAHYVFSPEFVIEMGEDHHVELKRFSYVDDAGELHDIGEYDEINGRNAFGCNYGIGIFEFQKIYDKESVN